MQSALRSSLIFSVPVRRLFAFAADVKPYVRDDPASDVVRLTETPAQGKRAPMAPSSRANARRPSRRTRAAAADKRRLQGRALLGSAPRIAADPKDDAGWLALARTRRRRRRRAGQQSLGPGRRRARPPPMPPISRRQTPDDQAEALALARQPLRPPRELAPRARRLSREPAAQGQRRRAQELRGPARQARLPHRRL